MASWHPRTNSNFQPCDHTYTRREAPPMYLRSQSGKVNSQTNMFHPTYPKKNLSQAPHIGYPPALSVRIVSISQDRLYTFAATPPPSERSVNATHHFLAWHPQTHEFVRRRRMIRVFGTLRHDLAYIDSLIRTRRLAQAWLNMPKATPIEE